MAPRSKVLLLCVGNACRSQMAEAIAKHVAADVIEPSSAKDVLCPCPVVSPIIAA